MMAKLMHFYNGLTVSDHDRLSRRRRHALIGVMNNSLAKREAST